MGEKTTNVSIRIPDDYRKQLQLQADKKSISFNAHVLRVLEIHLMSSGFGPTSIASPTGRLFQIRYEPYLDNVDETTWHELEPAADNGSPLDELGAAETNQELTSALDKLSFNQRRDRSG